MNPAESVILLTATDYDAAIMGAVAIIALVIIVIILLVTLELRKP